MVLTPDSPSQGTTGQLVAYNDRLSPDASVTELVNAEYLDVNMDVPNFGLDRGPIWLNISLVNATDRRGEWLLSLNRALLDSLRVILVRESNVTTILTLADQLESYNNFGTLAAPFTLDGNATAELYILYEGSNSSILPLTIETRDSNSNQQLWDLIIFFVSLAGITTLIIYNSVIGIITKLPAFLFYGLAQISLFSYFAHLSGITTVYLWPESPEFGTQFAPIVSVLTALFNGLFVRSFIGKTLIPNWLFKSFGALVYASYLSVVLMLFSGFTGVDIVGLNLIAVLLPSVTVLLLPVAGTLASRGGRFRYLPMTVAWYWLAISVSYTTLTVTNLAPVVPEFLTLYVGFSFVRSNSTIYLTRP